MESSRFRSLGFWSLTSKTDPRWDTSGHAHVGGYEMPEDAVAHIVEKRKTLGEIPEDLEYYYLKD